MIDLIIYNIIFNAHNDDLKMEEFILLLLKNFLYIYIMKVILCVKKIYNTLIYITVKYYKFYNNT